jgi:DNA-directed RNA polymerase specialized sigma subunit
MFAEGTRTWDGVTCPILPSTAKMVKSAGCGLVTYKLIGGYFTSPRWGGASIRRGMLHGAPVKVYTPETLQTMSNEELVRLYYQGDQDALSQLCLKNEKLIVSLAHKTAGSFNYHDSEERCSVGMLAFVELLSSRDYDPEKARLSTYIFPHIQGAMHRFLEKNTGSIALTKYQMDLIRKAQRLYHATNLAVEAVATELGIPAYRAEQLLTYNTHDISLEQLFEDEKECPFSEPME